MYTEMLSEGMVRDETKRKEYLGKLHSEANRLSHLVATVLAHARLESGRASRHEKTIGVASLLEETKDRLADRARQAGMELEMKIAAGCGAAMVRVDSSAIAQILLNLFDNSCKYASSASDRRIQLRAECNPRTVTLRVRDYGPGVAKTFARGLFRPFSKSAHEAARSATEVGLGLALSRRFARDASGDLEHDRSVEDGAAFVLSVPLVGEGQQNSMGGMG